MSAPTWRRDLEVYVQRIDVKEVRCCFRLGRNHQNAKIARATTPHLGAFVRVNELSTHESPIPTSSGRNMALKLPAHLTYKTALALLPPISITPPIEAVRGVHDKNYRRWPPHINLIYPFLASPLETSDSNTPRLSQAIRARLEKATSGIHAFHVSLSADPPGTFTHSKTSKTLWLGPVPDQKVKQLQAALQAEFAECDSDERAFTPHLSVGQARTDKVAEQLSKEITNSIAGFCQTQDGTPKALEWFVKKVYVIERKGFHGRFTVVGSVDLAREQHVS